MINLENLITNKVHLAKNFHIQPSEIEKMPMWEYELFMKILNNTIEAENKQQQKEMDKYDIDSYRKMASPSNLNKMTQTPKMPSMNINMPKIQ